MRIVIYSPLGDSVSAVGGHGERDPTPKASVALFLTLSSLAAACGAEFPTESLREAQLVGTYEATTLVSATTSTDSTDWLERGAILWISLASDGSTNGRLFLPGASEEGEDIDASLDGSWSLDAQEEVIHFDHDADTFVRDMPFEVMRVQDLVLRGEDNFGDLTMLVVLERRS